MVLLMITGCTKEHEVEHTLECLLKSVVNTETEEEVIFKKEDVISNGFAYNFRVYNDDIVVVSSKDKIYGEDVYLKDQQIERSYSLQREDGVDANMKFIFSKKYDDVEFLVLDKNITYTYSCTH